MINRYSYVLSLVIARPPKSPLFPYTTLFRSGGWDPTGRDGWRTSRAPSEHCTLHGRGFGRGRGSQDRKSTRLNSSHPSISYAVFCLKKKTVLKEYFLDLAEV